MKLLMFYMNRFCYTPRTKVLEGVDDVADTVAIKNAVVGFIHAEATDVDDAAGVETKLIKNLKWAARKNDTQTIVLHSFTHLSDSTAPAEFARDLLQRAQKRLVDSGYTATTTPFGYILDLEIETPGESLARLFKSF